MTETFRSLPRLLVSVRNSQESLEAWKGGADIIDIKEPTRGSLGMSDPQTVEEILRALAHPDAAPVSVALGELPEWNQRELPWRQLQGIRWGKLGLAGSRDLPDWREEWNRIVSSVPFGLMSWIAVIYADWIPAGTPPPEEILQHAARLGCVGVLIDTWDKTRSRLVDFLPLKFRETLEQFRQQRTIPLALAGSLTEAHLPFLTDYQPEILGIRGAACRNCERTGVLNSDLVRHFRQSISSLSEGRG